MCVYWPHHMDALGKHRDYNQCKKQTYWHWRHSSWYHNKNQMSTTGPKPGAFSLSVSHLLTRGNNKPKTKPTQVNQDRTHTHTLLWEVRQRQAEMWCCFFCFASWTSHLEHTCMYMYTHTHIGMYVSLSCSWTTVVSRSKQVQEKHRARLASTKKTRQRFYK